MTWLRVDVIAFVDESFPGFVRCAFTDADGNRHTFIEKVPCVTTQDLWSDSIYPQQGAVQCAKVEDLGDGTDRLTRVAIGVLSMEPPSDLEQFVVRESQLLNE